MWLEVQGRPRRGTRGGLLENRRPLRYERAWATVLGGHSLVPLLNLRLARSDVVVDIGLLAELESIEQVDLKPEVGAVTTQADVEADQGATLACRRFAPGTRRYAKPHPGGGCRADGARWS